MTTRVERLAGASVAACYQCDRCSSGCPMLFAMDLTPAQIVHSLRLGREDSVLHSRTIWTCVACQTCSTRCPQGIDIDQLINAARVVARKEQIDPHPEVKEIPNFYRSYIENLYLYGRLGEVPLIVTLKLKEENFFDDFIVGLRLLARGKIGLFDLPHGGDTFREVYRRTLEKEQSK